MDAINDLTLLHKELYEMVHQSDRILIEIDKPEHIKILQEKFLDGILKQSKYLVKIYMQLLPDLLLHTKE
jgi:hypothetical protein